VRGLILAWAVGEGIIIYRSVKVNHAPPMPGALLASSGLFVLLAVLAEAGPEAATLAAVLAWGFDAAAFLNLVPQVTGGKVTSSVKTESASQPASGEVVA